MFDNLNNILFKASNSSDYPELKAKCLDAKRDMRESVTLAKTIWIITIVETIHSMRFNPKAAWKAICILKKGHSAHHEKSNSMKFTLPSGLITKTDKEVVDVLLTHFKKVYDRSAEADWNVFNRMQKHGVMHSIGNIMSLEYVDVCLEKLTWHKSPGKNSVSPNAVKVLELDLKIKLLNCTNEWLMN